MKSKIFLTILFAIICSHVAFASDTSNTGFIPGQIWYSVDPLVEGDTVKVYTAVWNGDANPLEATVEFYDKNVILGSRPVSVPRETTQNVSINWKVTAGDHVISAKILASKITESGKSHPVVLARNATDEDRLFVPKVLEQLDGTPVTTNVALKSKLDETKSNISNVLPDSISKPVSSTIGGLDSFRDETYTKIVSLKDDTKKVLDNLNNPKAQVKGAEVKAKAVETKSLGGADKPVAYVKLFILSIVGFLFGSPFVFYLALAILLFLLIRSIYRKLRII
jgi:hypothetical protein